ncbi:MAG: Secretion system C-terminal sorting domain [Bacteroidetes bacterium]|jgi:hypothetical protein|nr:Secretion system C-terminal sorting domain [Bacteroidota bacterium]
MNIINKTLYLVTFLLFLSQLRAQTFSASNVQQPTCFGSCNGSVTFTTASATGPFNMVMTNSLSCPNSTISSSTNSAITISSVCPCASDYTVSIFTGTVLVGVDYVQFPVTSTTALNVTASTVVAATCSSCCTGSVYVNWSGGNTQVSSPTITIDGAPTASYSPAVGLCPGPHTLCATDAASCTTCTGFTVTAQPPTGISENTIDNNLTIFPNPASSEITLQVTQGTEISLVRILDLSGRNISEHSVSYLRNVKLDISKLTNGLYYLEVYGQNNSIQRNKFVKTSL